MINNVVLTGRITKDLDLKYTGSGTAVLNFSIAVERNFKNRNGERETDFINIVAFTKTAELINQYFKKGDGIGITGRIQTGSYQNNEGRTIYTTDVVADNFDFPIQNKRQQNNNQGNQNNYNQPNQQQAQQQNNNPFENVDFSSNDPFANNPDVIDIGDDDLPFD